MNSLDYILTSANLPFDLGSIEPEADRLFAAVPAPLMRALNLAELHSAVVEAGDQIAIWIAKNWRTVLPEIARNFAA